MSGLRDRKKEIRKNRIFESALKLFGELGYEKTTMEKIATNAELGVGTLYNYYPSKMVLLFSIIEAGTGKYIAELDEVICKCEYLKESVFEFYYIYMKSFATYGKRVWGDVFGEVLFKQPNIVNMIDIIDKQFSNKLKELLLVFRDRSSLKENADIEAAVAALYALLGYNIIRYVSEDEMTEKELTEALKSQAGLIVDAITKSGELL